MESAPRGRGSAGRWRSSEPHADVAAAGSGRVEGRLSPAARAPSSAKAAGTMGASAARPRASSARPKLCAARTNAARAPACTADAASRDAACSASTRDGGWTRAARRPGRADRGCGRSAAPERGEGQAGRQLDRADRRLGSGQRVVEDPSVDRRGHVDPAAAALRARVGGADGAKEGRPDARVGQVLPARDREGRLGGDHAGRARAEAQLAARPVLHRRRVDVVGRGDVDDRVSDRRPRRLRARPRARRRPR